MGHWYDSEGNPQHYVNGRDSTLRDARKFKWLPSVTGVLDILDKPGLTNWKVDTAILAALTLPRGDNESEPDWLRRVKQDAGAQARLAAEEGNRIHDAIDCHFKGKPVPAFYEPHVEAVLRKLHELYPGVSDWVSELTFAGDGYGGCVDLHSPSTGLTGDHKGKDGDFTDGKKLAYEQHYQLAAYQRGLRLPASEAFNLFVSRTHPGKVAHHIWTIPELEQGWRVFTAALALWKAVKNYDPQEK